jgi:N-acetylmuramoyl-L-alanine amidase
MSPRIPLAFLLLLALVMAATPRAQQLDGIDAAAIRAAIERRLTLAPRGFERLTPPAQAGVRVLDVRVDRSPQARQRITIDLSQRALTYDPSGDTELVIDQILNSVAALTSDTVEFRFLVEGLPLEQFANRAPAPPFRTFNTTGTRPVVISAGHGLYFNEHWNTWMLQRSYYWGLAEDLVNWEIARHTLDELAAHRIDARPARHPEQWAGPGSSGYMHWQESAKYYLRALGVPWEVSDFGANEYNRDINSRPFYANFVDAAALISIHNNGGGGTGTETWYDETNGWADDSRRLAQIVNDRVVQAIRTHYNPDWPDRGLRSCNGCKGETRLASRPAVIVEIAFVDMAWPDNAALQDDRFRRIVAQAIREAVQQWAGVTVAMPAQD